MSFKIKPDSSDQFYILNQNVNMANAVDFLGNRNDPYWQYNVSHNKGCK